MALITPSLVFAGRLDYVYLGLALLADRRHRMDPAVLDELIGYVEARGLLLVSANARRLRGQLRQDHADLQAALEAFEQMGARPSIARVSTELGLLTGDGALVERGVDELEAIGDVEHAARVSAERKRAAQPA